MHVAVNVMTNYKQDLLASLHYEWLGKLSLEVKNIAGMKYDETMNYASKNKSDVW